MKPFDEWLAEGPLAADRLTSREKTIAQIAYNEGSANAIEQSRVALERILQGGPAVLAPVVA